MPSAFLALGGDRSEMVPLITVRSGKEGRLKARVRTGEKERAGHRSSDPAIKHIIPRSRRQLSHDVARTPFPFEEFGRTPRVLYARAGHAQTESILCSRK